MPLYSAACPIPINRKISRHKAQSSFSPSDLSDLSLWLKADAGITLSGSNVTAWADQSGNGRNAIPHDIAPTYISSSSDLNNHPAISFNADGSSFQIPQSNIGENGNISIFIVINYSTGYVFLNKGDAATFENTSWELSIVTGFGFVNSYNETLSWNVVPVSPNTNVPLLLEAFSSVGVSQIAYNGNNSDNPSSANDGFNNLSQYIGIGAGGDGGGLANLDARIGEIVIYNRQVTLTERQLVETYLLGKYAINSTPSGISVASTNQISISGAGEFNGVYNRTNSSGTYIPEPISGTYNYISANGVYYLTSPGNTNYNNDYAGNDWVLATGSDGVTIYSENTSTDAAIIPANGWSPSITITAI